MTSFGLKIAQTIAHAARRVQAVASGVEQIADTTASALENIIAFVSDAAYQVDKEWERKNEMHHSTSENDENTVRVASEAECPGFIGLG